MDKLLFLVFLGIVIGIYFLPSLIAAKRNHSSMGGVLVINVFLGWTFLGWVIALAWAASGRHTPAAD